jgi:CRISPR-associated protein Cmr2
MINTYEKHPLTGDKLSEKYKIDLPDMNLEDKEIAIFTIGPVQSFISAAKKIKEFWAGSYLLSYLTWQAIEHTIEKAGEDSIIFPMVTDQPFYQRFIENKENVSDLEMPTLPNRFMAVLDKENSQEILKECEIRVTKKLYEIFNSKPMNFKLSNSDHEAVKKQIEELLEIYWVSIPATEDINEIKKRFKNLKGSESNNSTYSILTSLAEELLGSRKNLRDFNFVEEKGSKCFICGERSALIDVRFEDEDRKICGVCALKRNFEKYFNKYISPASNLYYPSVIEIATMDYKESLLQELKKDNLLDDFLRTFDRNTIKNYSGKLLSRWKDKESKDKSFLKISGDTFDLDSDILNDNQELKFKISKYNKKYGLKLNKYYSLIYLDGDSMGKWVSGELINKEMTPELHALVSKALTNYSLRFVKNIVEKNGRKGKVIYAGGDDVVAFVNLDDLFTVMRELSAYFSGSIKDNQIDFINSDGIVDFNGEKIMTLGSKASISLGACIAHYKEPLSLVIKKAQKMESKAKENRVEVNGLIKQKDAFSLGLVKNSGEVREAGAKWIYDNTDLIKDAIDPLLKIIRENKLSRNFVYVLKEELKLIDDTNRKNDITLKLVRSEIKRLAKRKSFDADKEDEKLLTQALDNISFVYETANISPGVNNLDNFISLLEIIFFIGKKGE